MTDLKDGVLQNDIAKILGVLADKKVNLLSDPLIAQYLQELLRSVRLKALESICRPYKAVKLDFLMKRMDVDLAEIRSLLAELILEERLQGSIDQVQGVLELRGSELQTAQKHTAIRKWADTLVDINKKLFQKVNFDQMGGHHGPMGGFGRGFDDDDDYFGMWFSLYKYKFINAYA